MLTTSYSLDPSNRKKKCDRESPSDMIHTSNGSSNLSKDTTPTTSPNPDIILSVQHDDFLPSMGWLARWSGLTIVGAVGIAFLFASVTHYKVVVKGQASVRPSGELRLVQSAIEGTVTEIPVTVNQSVQEGDVIAFLDNSQLQTKKSQLLQSIQFTQLQLIQINSQVQSITNQLTAEIERRNRSVASAEAELDQRRRQYRDSDIVANATVQESIANLRSAETAFEAAQLKWERYRPIAEAGAISMEQLEEVELAAQQRGQEVEIAHARLHQAEAALNPSQAEIEIAAAHIDQEKALGSATLANLQQEQEALIQQKFQIRNQLSRDSRDLQQLEIDLNRTVITTPTPGIISTLHIRNSGQTIRPGENIASIAPSDAELIVKALISAQDIGKVEIGQQVKLRISACPYPNFGTANGQVKSISPDAIANPEDVTTRMMHPVQSDSRRQPTPALYEVMIQLDRLSLHHREHECHIQIGMEGRADIITKEETILQFILRKARLIADL